MGQTRYPSKSRAFTSGLSFKVRQRSTATLSSIQNMLHSLQNGRCSFIFITLLVQTTILKFTLKIRSSTPVNFYLHIPPLLVHKIILTIITPFPYTSAIFYLPIFAYNHPNNLHRKHFPCLSHLANSGCVKGSGSGVRESCEN